MSIHIRTNYENLVKILILGDTSVGKTNFLFRFTDNSFMDNYITTIGCDFKSQIINMDDNKKVKLQIWDTAGQERFMSVTKNMLLRVQGIILLYDITARSSFEHISGWAKSIQETCEGIPMIIVGNKTDLETERTVTTEEGKKMAKDFGVQFKEASAKEDINVKDTFTDLTKEILEKFDIRQMGSLSLRKSTVVERKENEKKRCCQ